jgi:twitching motility protein PilT
MSWTSALKNVLRQSPDVIVIGELQDRQSIASAVSAAETGHLVLASLHANDAVNAVTRMIDVFPGDQQTQIRIQLASTLAGVLVQELVPTVSGEGRVLATEFMAPNPAIRNLIRTGNYIQIHNTIVNGRANGMHTMQDSLESLLASGRVSQEQVLQRLNEKRMVSATC